ncbi:MAG: hypothetical protein H8D45_11110 [Bacteroidetes bacterium]|nr:hypothetical protein [Bacteroidota bacterium]
MGSSISKIYDDMADEQWEVDKKWLTNEAKKVKEINPSSSEFRDLKWLKQNEEKILRNRRLIELLG